MLPIIVSGPMLSMSFILLRKSVASLAYDLVLDISGCRKVSTNADIFSVGQPLAETMGLPGGGVYFGAFVLSLHELCPTPCNVCVYEHSQCFTHMLYH